MKKIFIIRHIRYFILRVKFNIWWHTYGCKYWLVPNESDIQYMKDVWSGKQ